MMTEEQVQRHAHNLRGLICENATVRGFRYDVVLDAIDRACDLGLQHIATLKRVRDRANRREEPTDDLEHDARREYDLIEGTEIEDDPSCKF